MNRKRIRLSTPHSGYYYLRGKLLAYSVIETGYVWYWFGKDLKSHGSGSSRITEAGRQDGSPPHTPDSFLNQPKILND